MNLNIWGKKEVDRNQGKIGDLPTETPAPEEVNEEVNQQSSEDVKPTEDVKPPVTENPEEGKTGTYQKIKAEIQAKGLKKNIIYGVIGLAAFAGALSVGSNILSDKQAPPPNNNSGASSMTHAKAKMDEIGYEELAQMDRGNKNANAANTPGSGPMNPNQPGMNPNAPTNLDNNGPNNMYAHTTPSYSVPTGPAVAIVKETPAYIGSDISFGYTAEAANKASSVMDGIVSASAYEENYVLKAGTTIPVTLLTGITSDLSGVVIVQVRQDVYDSLNGVAILIPAGAKLLGKYSSGSADGRMSVEFSSMQLPNGQTIDLAAAHGIDGIGFAGVKDKYSEHTGRVLGASFVSSLIAAVAGSGSSGFQKDERSRGQEALDSAVGNLIETTNKIVDKKLDSSPTATIRPGFRFNVFLGEDLTLPRY